MFNNAKKYLFGYDATESSNRRRSRGVSLKSEDKTLNKTQRKKLVSDVRDLHRNFAVAQWAKEKHLDYVSTFSFQARTGDTQLDQRIEELVDWWSRPFNFDVAGRHSLQRFTRLAEERAVTDGDFFSLLLADGKVQGIEGDRVQTPTDTLPKDFDPESWAHGIRVSPSGRPVEYAVCDRAANGSGFALKTVIPAKFVVPLGFYNRVDQVRGVSPIASALNTWSDLYEANEYYLAKAKVAALFGIKFTRAADGSLDGATDETALSDYQLDFSKGPALLDLDPGDDADFLESKTPPAEFISYSQEMTAAALKSLSIPFSFYNESFTNYSGARQAMLQYEQSASIRRNEIRALLDRLTRWRLGLFIDDGVLSLPRGMSIADLGFEWVGQGLPWVSPLQEANAEILLIGAGLTSRQDVCKQHGRDFYEIVDKLAQEQAYLAEKGVGLSEAQSQLQLVINENGTEENR